MTMLQWALDAASRGFRVFPVRPANPDGTCPCKDPTCTSAGKHPAITAWQSRATTDVTQITKWWNEWPNHNIGIATGHESNLLVLDADGGDGLLAVEERGLPDTPVSVRTGRVDGGTHFYFQCPDDFDARNFAGKVPGLDARANGGYVIAAGSKHKTGAVYVYVNSPDDYEIPPPPKWFVELLNDRAPRSKSIDEVPEGQRNNTLFYMARGFRRDGMPEEQVLTSIRAVNAGWKNKALPDNEVRTLVDSACREEYGAAPQYDINIAEPDLGVLNAAMPELRSLPMTELGMAEAFALVVAGRFLYVHEWKQWMRWTGSVWERDNTSAAQRTMNLVARMRGIAANYIQEKEDKQALQSWASKMENTRQTEQSLKAATALLPLIEKPEHFDRTPMLLAAEGVTINLGTGIVYDPNPDDRISLRVAIKYDLEAECPKWIQTLQEVFKNDQEMIAYFQRACGYSITGSNKEQCMFICHGHGANGKSTLLSVIRNVIGGYSATARYETFDMTKASSRGEDLAMLRGKRFCLVVEPDASMRLSEGRIKQVTGGEDLITCRHLYGRDFSYQPEFKLWMALNHKPEVRGTDQGIWRRIHLIPFDASFEGEERNQNLATELKDEYPGILNWLITGAQEWANKGLMPPKAVMDATAEYRAESDVFGQWMGDSLVEGADEEATASDLYLSYTTWCRNNGHRQPMTSNAFSRQLTERGFEKRMNKARKTTYKGISVTDAGWGLD
jgi:putative DNA primase/helicase